MGSSVCQRGSPLFRTTKRILPLRTPPTCNTMSTFRSRRGVCSRYFQYENFAFFFVTKKNIYNSSCSYDNSDYDLLKMWIGSKLSKVGVLSGNGDGDWSWLGSVKFNRPISPYPPHCLHLWAGLGSNLFCSQPPIPCLPYWHLGLLRLVSQYD